MNSNLEPQSRIRALRSLLEKGQLSSQDELREELEDLKFKVTQSTISRDLRRIGAVKAVDSAGRTVYKLPRENSQNTFVASSLNELVFEIRSNEQQIVIKTQPGSASLVARHLDQTKPHGILGTIAGDDTIFVAPKSCKDIRKTILAIQESLL